MKLFSKKFLIYYLACFLIYPTIRITVGTLQYLASHLIFKEGLPFNNIFGVGCITNYNILVIAYSISLIATALVLLICTRYYQFQFPNWKHAFFQHLGFWGLESLYFLMKLGFKYDYSEVNEQVIIFKNLASFLEFYQSAKLVLLFLSIIVIMWVLYKEFFVFKRYLYLFIGATLYCLSFYLFYNFLMTFIVPRIA